MIDNDFLQLFRGRGKLKLLSAQCNKRFKLRGLLKWESDLSYDDLIEAFNHGILVIMLDASDVARIFALMEKPPNTYLH